jgi:ABC-type antimicrobial peptide transport system permease subunit
MTYGKKVRPNEVFVGGEPGIEGQVLAAVKKLTNGSAVLRSSSSQLEAIRRDPLEGAAWQALAGISLGVVLVASCVGYVAYLLSIGSRYRAEFGLLQAMGLSRRQLAPLAGFEPLIILPIGMALGTRAGLRMGSLMVSSLATPGSGPQAVPPIELATNWAQILPVYIAVRLIAGASLIVLNRRALQMDLRDISSLTE